MLPSNTLVLELTDGLYIWPPSSHIRRTASGAVPAIIPEISLSPDAQANTLLSSYRNPSGRIYVLLSSHGSVCNAGMLVRRLAADVPKVKWLQV